jgi:hypothetical protein
LDGHVLNIHDEWSIIPVSLTTGPLNGACGFSGGTSIPVTELDLHWSLRVVLAVQSIAVVELADSNVVDGPDDTLGSPVDSVKMPAVLGSGDVIVNSTIIGGGVALAEVVGLDRSGVTTKPFLQSKSEDIQISNARKSYPVNFIKVVRFHNNTANDTGAVGSFHVDFDLAKEDVVSAGDGWGLTLRLHDELGSILSVGESGAFGQSEVFTLSSSEVDSDGLAECWVRGTCG